MLSRLEETELTSSYMFTVCAGRPLNNCTKGLIIDVSRQEIETWIPLDPPSPFLYDKDLCFLLYSLTRHLIVSPCSLSGGKFKMIFISISQNCIPESWLPLSHYRGGILKIISVLSSHVLVGRARWFRNTVKIVRKHPRAEPASLPVF